MCKLTKQKTTTTIEFIDPRSAIKSLSVDFRIAANSNRRDWIAAHGLASNPKAIAEAEKLAVEALYLGADTLEMLQRVNAQISAELSEETAKLAKMLMFWGAGAALAIAENKQNSKA